MIAQLCRYTLKKFVCPKRGAMFWNGFLSYGRFCTQHSQWIGLGLRRTQKIFCVREILPPGPGYFWIEFPKPTGYHVSVITVSESGSQKSQVPSSLRMMNTKSTISQELKIANLSELVQNLFQTIAHLMGQKKFTTFKEFWTIISQ